MEDKFIIFILERVNYCFTGSHIYLSCYFRVKRETIQISNCETEIFRLKVLPWRFTIRCTWTLIHFKSLVVYVFGILEGVFFMITRNLLQPRTFFYFFITRNPLQLPCLGYIGFVFLGYIYHDSWRFFSSKTMELLDGLSI
jgi:hypothetical protein